MRINAFTIPAVIFLRGFGTPLKGRIQDGEKERDYILYRSKTFIKYSVFDIY